MGMMKNGLGALALVAMAGAANATPVNLSQQDPNDIFGGGGSANVTVNANGQTTQAQAGGFRVTDGVENFVAWCLDIFNTVSLPAPYTITETPFTGATFTTTVVDNLTRLFNTAYTSVNLSNNAQSAGFQLALWEVITEGDPAFDVTSGDFQWTGGSTGARDFANEYLDMMSGPETEQFVLTFFQSGFDDDHKQISQNLVSVAPIPLPAGVWLLGAGLLGLVAVGRRRRNAAAA